MKLYLNQDISFYQLVFNSSTPQAALSLSAATLLALMRAQIDLLIEQQIAATLWVKLPPGQIWHTELIRYKSAQINSSQIYNCQMGEPSTNNPAYQVSCACINVQLLPNAQLSREYFLLILSPQFCSLIIVVKPYTIAENNSVKIINSKHQPLLSTLKTFDGKIIQSVIEVIKQAIPIESSPVIPNDFAFPLTANAHLLDLLLTKQLYRQEEINIQTIAKNKNRVKFRQNNPNLHHQENLKHEYLTTVCHELRKPLTHMKTALSLLSSSHLKISQRQRYLQMLNQQCDRQNSLINGLIDLIELEQNLEATQLEALSLADILPGVVSIYQPVAQEKGINLACSIPATLPRFWCVSGKFRQIVINLLHNSIKFTPPGGQVLVCARLKGNYVQLEFKDTGIGIAENEIPKIFELFYRVRTVINDDTNGAGLGLTIVKQLLQHSGGSIYVKSKLDEGSIFIVNLAVAWTKPRIALEQKL